LVSFDSRAAIETAELIAAVKTNKEQWSTWAKVKFDIQIVAIAKAEGASVIYSDDRDVENYAKRFNIRVVRICDLPAPPPPATTSQIDDGSMGPQMPLALEPALVAPRTAAPIAPEASPDRSTPEASPPISVESDRPSRRFRELDALQTSPARPSAVQGSDRGHAHDEPPAKGVDKADDR